MNEHPIRQQDPPAAQRGRAAGRVRALARGCARRAKRRSRARSRSRRRASAGCGGILGALGGFGGLSLRLIAADCCALAHRPGRGLQLAAGAACRGNRRARRAAAHGRPADRRLPRPGLRGVAEEGLRLQPQRLCARPGGGRCARARRKRRRSAAAEGPRPAGPALTAEQQQIARAAQERLGQPRQPQRRNWISLAKRYPKMKPEEQQRVQRRMQSWAKLTPEQRKQARENYRRISMRSMRETRDRSPGS